MTTATSFTVYCRLPLSPFSGYGNDGIGIVRALQRWGATVVVEPTVVQPPIDKDIAMLLTKPTAAPFDMALYHVDPEILEAPESMREYAKVVVGWTMWEYDNLHNLAGAHENEPDFDLTKYLREKFQYFDVLVGYDENSTNSLREYFDGPILTIQGGYWPEDWPEIERDWFEEDFYFSMIGVLSERKDPMVAIQAFSELKNEHEDFNEHARLMLKTTAPGLHKAMEDVYPGLRIFFGMWDTETVLEFYAKTHVLISPSRGEGKNMPALEFLSTGGTVIATNWAGHLQWLSDAYAYRLDYTLVQTDPRWDTQNARADVNHLKELMLHTFRNRGEAKQKGSIAAQVIPGLASWDNVMERLFLQVNQAVPDAKVWDGAMRVRKVSKRADG